MKSVWRKAAELVDMPNVGIPGLIPQIGCCAAIPVAKHGDYRYPPSVPECLLFGSYFSPTGNFDTSRGFWWAHPEHGDPVARDARVIALLLMELIERDGGL